MNQLSQSIFTLVQRLTRDEKRLFIQYLPLWASDATERYQLEYLFKLYETAKPKYVPEQQAEQLWSMLLSTIRLLGNNKDALQTLADEDWNAVQLENFGLIERLVKRGKLSRKKALTQNPPECFMASLNADRDVFIAMNQTWPENISVEEADKLYQEELDLVQREIELLENGLR